LLEVSVVFYRTDGAENRKKNDNGETLFLLGIPPAALPSLLFPHHKSIWKNLHTKSTISYTGYP